ncbi:MAG: retropepsin-like aspartic protease family protein [Xenococcaceae cyanobacterium]
MKRIICALVCLTGVTSIASVTQAQEVDGCFFLDDRGQPVNISSLCPVSRQEKSSLQQKILEEGVFSVPIKRRLHGIPVIDVVFNNTYEFEMMLDTGASSIVITKDMAKKLDFEPQGIMIVSTPSDNNVPVPKGYVDSVSAGGAVSRDVMVAVSSVLDLGLLGQDFFSHYDILIKKNVVEFRSR